jgi:hypothetical protein
MNGDYTRRAIECAAMRSTLFDGAESDGHSVSVVSDGACDFADIIRRDVMETWRVHRLARRLYREESRNADRDSCSVYVTHVHIGPEYVEASGYADSNLNLGG